MIKYSEFTSMTPNLHCEPYYLVSLFNLVFSDFSLNLIGNVLVSLTLKDTRTGLTCLLASEGLDR